MVIRKYSVDMASVVNYMECCYDFVDYSAMTESFGYSDCGSQAFRYMD
jgi:hypothetical protein